MKALHLCELLMRGDNMFLERAFKHITWVRVAVLISSQDFTSKMSILVLAHGREAGSTPEFRSRGLNIFSFLVNTPQCWKPQVRNLCCLICLFSSTFSYFSIQLRLFHNRSRQRQNQTKIWYFFSPVLPLPSISLKVPLPFSSAYPPSKARNDRNESPEKLITPSEGVFPLFLVRLDFIANFCMLRN